VDPAERFGEVVDGDESLCGELVCVRFAAARDAAGAGAASCGLRVVAQVDVRELVSQGAATPDAVEAVVDGDASDVVEVPGLTHREAGQDEREVRSLR
jgi:hypothetical protein